MDTSAPQSNVEFRERLRRHERRMHTQYGLRFDGSTLSLLENGKAIADWPAVSGREGYQEPEYQAYRDYGPLPQGLYRMRTGAMQRLEDTSDWEQFKGRFGFGPWPGGSESWGRYRFWLTPDAATPVLGRDNFSIHGGEVPGSAGCIDLTSEMDDFADLMQALGQDEVDVRVDYGRQGPPHHRYR